MNSCDITLCHANSLSIVERLNSSQHVGILLNQVGQVIKVLATLFWCNLLPGSLVRLARSCYGNIDILLGGLVYRADNLLVRGVDNFKCLSVNTLDEFVVDKSGE